MGGGQRLHAAGRQPGSHRDREGGVFESNAKVVADSGGIHGFHGDFGLCLLTGCGVDAMVSVFPSTLRPWKTRQVLTT